MDADISGIWSLGYGNGFLYLYPDRTMKWLDGNCLLNAVGTWKYEYRNLRIYRDGQEVLFTTVIGFRPGRTLTVDTTREWLFLGRDFDGSVNGSMKLWGALAKIGGLLRRITGLCLLAGAPHQRCWRRGFVAIPSCPKTQTNSRLARRAVSIVIDLWRAPDLGRVGGDVGDSRSPYTQGKHRPATGCHAPGRRPGSRPGLHLDQNVLAGYAAVALALILDPSGGLFSDAARPCQRPAPPLWRKRGTRKSRLETKTENEASSALLARLC